MGNHYHESPLVKYAKAGMSLNIELNFQPLDEYWQYQWRFRNVLQGGQDDADIDLDEAFDFWTDPSRFITVAILDDGFEPHEDFPASRIIGGWDYYDDDPIYAPGGRQVHGMACMGIIAAETASEWNDPRLGVAGICDHVRIIGQKISSNNDNVYTDIEDADLADAFSDAVLQGARIISDSWSVATSRVPTFPTTVYWIRKADSAGVTIIGSAGNTGAAPPPATQEVRFPANMPEVIAVGASDSVDGRWNYSSFGAELDVVAPSGNMPLGKFAGQGHRGHFWTFDQMGIEGINDGSMDCYVNDLNYNCGFGGTSAAAPQVTGVVALVLFRRPDLIGQTETMRQIIRHSSEDKGSPGWDPYYGRGRLDAARALLAVVRGDADNSGGYRLRMPFGY